MQHLQGPQNKNRHSWLSNIKTMFVRDSGIPCYLNIYTIILVWKKNLEIHHHLTANPVISNITLNFEEMMGGEGREPVY